VTNLFPVIPAATTIFPVIPAHAGIQKLLNGFERAGPDWWTPDQVRGDGLVLVFLLGVGFIF
jgi:hypothetical protein